MPRTQITTLLLSLATLSVPALAQGTYPAVRDYSSALNYVQGQATLDGQPVTTNPSSTPHRLHTGDVLATTNGTADVMLAPGALLRLGQNTSVQLVANDGNRAEARLQDGHANVAVNLVPHDKLVLVDLPQGQTQLLKRGLYTFDVPSETVRVYNGEADAFPGSNTDTNVKPTKVKDNHEVVLNSARLHATSFDQADAQEDLIPWTGPQETRASLAAGTASYSGASYSGGYSGGYYPAAYSYGPYGYGDGPYAYGFGYPYPYLAYGWPYGFYDYPYGWGGYPWFGAVGFGYWGGGGWYGGRGVIGGAGLRGGYGGGFAGGGFRGGGFGGGGFHGGGGGGRR